MKRINLRLAAALAGVMLAAGALTPAISADWQEKGGNTYYLQENGEYSKGWTTIDGKEYYFKNSGVMLTKSAVIDGVRYRFSSDGVCQGKYTGWTKSAKGISRYWENGKTVTGWVNAGNKWYYIDKSKGRLTGTHTIDGLEYTFSKKGVWDGKVSGKAVNVENIWTKIYYKMNKKSYGGVYIKDGMIVVLSVDGKAEKAAEKLLSDTGGIVFKKAEYSIYEMEKIKEYIRKNHKRDWSEMYIDHTANRLMLGATKQQLERLQPYLDTLKNRDCIVLLDTTGDISYDD
ncbi:MAG: N-acetylmuramoyl-L-alanine amidase family protein [Ruminiclostridium sp.]